MEDKPTLVEVFNSRKFRMGVMSIGIVWAMGAMVSLIPEITGVVDSMINGVVYIYAIYCGMNVANKFVLTKKKNIETQESEG